MNFRKLTTCAEIFSGFSYRTLPLDAEKGSITLVQPKDVDQSLGRLLYDNALRISEFPGDNKHYLRSGDILVSGKGKTTPIVFFDGSKKNVISSSAFIIVRPFPGVVSPDYMAWYLQLPVAQKYFQSNKAGATVLNLSVKSVQELEICLPALTVQRKLGRLHCSLLEQNAKQLEVMAKERKLLNYLMYEQIKK